MKSIKNIRKVGSTFEIPTFTDSHSSDYAPMPAAYIDVLPIPAFLVRQTALNVAAAQTKKFVNIKKGQFMSSIIIDFAVQKVKNSSNENVWITDRGTQFGYQDLIVDFSGIPVKK